MSGLGLVPCNGRGSDYLARLCLCGQLNGVWFRYCEDCGRRLLGDRQEGREAMRILEATARKREQDKRRRFITLRVVSALLEGNSLSVVKEAQNFSSVAAL